jgi:hypothetical protein
MSNTVTSGYVDLENVAGGYVDLENEIQEVEANRAPRLYDPASMGFEVLLTGDEDGLDQDLHVVHRRLHCTIS